MKVSWFPEQFITPPGRLGLTHVPGGRDAHRDEDLDALKANHVDLILCLVEADELQWMEPSETLQDRREAVEDRGIAFKHHPIEDFEAPQLDATRQTVKALDAALQQGQTIIVHCWAGLGRAGTLAACLLVHNGMSPHDAIQTVRWIRPGAIQADVQEQLIAAFSTP